tara:strand:- start:707 stop:1270 length:564 start_codon:yes stop_codon:yes gene_type:complete
MKAAIETVKNIISPEQNWSKFLMKIVGLSAISAIGLIGFKAYTESKIVDDGGDKEISVLFEEDPSKKLKVEALLSGILTKNRDIKSVWLYDWPDARNIIPIANFPRTSIDPIPTGYWMPGDEEVIGHFVLAQCTQLPNRTFISQACSIMGTEDAWGVLVVTYEQGPVDKIANVTAKKISETLYLLPD